MYYIGYNVKVDGINWEGVGRVKSTSLIYTADLAPIFRMPLWHEAALTIFNPCVTPPGELDPRRRALIGHGWGLQNKKMPPVDCGSMMEDSGILTFFPMPTSTYIFATAKRRHKRDR